MKIQTTLFLLALVVAASCKSKDPFEAAGTELCACMRPMYDLQKQFQTLMEQGKQDELMKLIEDSEKVGEDMSACGKAIEAKYGVETLEKNDSLVTAAMKKACPDIVQMMEASQQQQQQQQLEDMMMDTTMQMEQGVLPEGAN